LIPTAREGGVQPELGGGVLRIGNIAAKLSAQVTEKRFNLADRQARRSAADA
jgi:hypothetical protein